MKIFYKPEQRPTIDPAIIRQKRDAVVSIFGRYAENGLLSDEKRARTLAKID